MSEFGLIKSFTGAEAIAARRIAAFADTEGEVAQATGGAAPIAGVIGIHACEGAGRRAEVIQHGYAEVDFGGDVAQGDPLSADAQGRAVAALPAAGSTVWILGYANQDGAAGEYGQVRVAPGLLTGGKSF